MRFSYCLAFIVLLQLVYTQNRIEFPYQRMLTTGAVYPHFQGGMGMMDPYSYPNFGFTHAMNPLVHPMQPMMNPYIYTMMLHYPNMFGYQNYFMNPHAFMAMNSPYNSIAKSNGY